MLNRKLAIKVLKEMEDELLVVESSLIRVPDETTKIKLFKEVRELRNAADRLKTYYQKLLGKNS